jgi:hypothetical protein
MEKAMSLASPAVAVAKYTVRTCVFGVCRKFRVRAISMGNRETSYGETEATNYFRRHA